MSLLNNIIYMAFGFGMATMYFRARIKALNEKVGAQEEPTEKEIKEFEIE